MDGNDEQQRRDKFHDEITRADGRLAVAAFAQQPKVTKQRH
jgi:hypothetical protein